MIGILKERCHNIRVQVHTAIQKNLRLWVKAWGGSAFSKPRHVERKSTFSFVLPLKSRLSTTPVGHVPRKVARKPVGERDVREGPMDPLSFTRPCGCINFWLCYLERVQWTLYIICKGSIGPFLYIISIYFKNRNGPLDPLHYMQRVHWTLPIYIYIFVLTFGEVQIMDLLYVGFGPFTTK